MRFRPGCLMIDDTNVNGSYQLYWLLKLPLQPGNSAHCALLYANRTPGGTSRESHKYDSGKGASYQTLLSQPLLILRII